MQKLIALLCLWALVVLNGLFSFMFAWGLEMKSWPIWFSTQFVGVILVLLLELVKQEDK